MLERSACEWGVCPGVPREAGVREWTCVAEHEEPGYWEASTWLTALRESGDIQKALEIRLSQYCDDLISPHEATMMMRSPMVGIANAVMFDKAFTCHLSFRGMPLTQNDTYYGER